MSPNLAMAEIHDYMPAILERGDIKTLRYNNQTVSSALRFAKQTFSFGNT